jgi:sigma-B regulation protein RsbU (phosphoserine phosphatase)
MSEITVKNNKILFVDDDTELLTTYELMVRKNCEVYTASNAEEGLERIHSEGPFAVVVSDFHMPGMNGIQFLNEVKNISPYSVRIILTSSDDIMTASYAVNESNIFRFLTKPIEKNKLLLAIDASIEQYRLVKAELELNKKLTEAYEKIKQDLEAAAKIQQRLLPQKKINLSGLEFNAKFIPSVFLSGDNFNYFNLDNRHIGFYLLDVSGHGVSSAMHSFALSNYITPDVSKNSPLKFYNPKKASYDLLGPSDVIKNLNERFLTKGSNTNYFTMVYGIIDLMTHELNIIHAGHPPSILIRRNGDIEVLYQKNFPVGILSDVEFYDKQIQFENGDKIFIYSDGVTECKSKSHKYFSEERLIDFMSKNKFKNSIELLNDLEQELRKWHIEENFHDDITFFMIEAKY